MTQDEALKMALEAQSYAAACLLNQLSTKDKHAYAVEKLSASTAAIKEALAQPEQEPVAWMVWGENNVPSFTFKKPSDKYVFDSLYIAPPQRAWVGLTDEEIYKIHTKEGWNGMIFAHAIEAKLKDKNGYSEDKNTRGKE